MKTLRESFVENVERGEFYVKYSWRGGETNLGTIAVSLKAQQKLNQPYD
jgi:hypothetical protein